MHLKKELTDFFKDKNVLQLNNLIMEIKIAKKFVLLTGKFCNNYEL